MAGQILGSENNLVEDLIALDWITVDRQSSPLRKDKTLFSIHIYFFTKVDKDFFFSNSVKSCALNWIVDKWLHWFEFNKLNVV